MQVLVDFTRLIVLDASIRRRVKPENLKIDRNLPEQSNHIDSSIRRTSRCNWDRSLILIFNLFLMYIFMVMENLSPGV